MAETVVLPDTITSIGDEAFYSCTSLTTFTIGDNVTNIGERAFDSCTSLITVTIGTNVTNIGDRAFHYCGKLRGACFRGNTPLLGGPSVFANDTHAIVAYVPGATGWGTTFGELPTALWDTQVPCAYRVDGPSTIFVKYSVSGVT